MTDMLGINLGLNSAVTDPVTATPKKWRGWVIIIIAVLLLAAAAWWASRPLTVMVP